MRKSYLAMASLAIAAIIVSCNKDEEFIIPEITEYSFNQESQEVVLTAGESFEFQAQVKDNVQLSKLNLSIEANNGNWSYSKSFNLSGTSASVNQQIELSSDASPGSCLIRLTAIDASGNKTSTAFHAMIEDNRPQISLSAPSISSSDNLIHLSAGSPVTFMGLITDNEDLSKVLIQINVKNNIGGPSQAVNEEIDFNGSNDTSWDFDGGYTVMIPQNAISVNYQLIITALDNKGNFSTFKHDVKIAP